MEDFGDCVDETVDGQKACSQGYEAANSFDSLLPCSLFHFPLPLLQCLTFLRIVKDLHLALLRPKQGLCQLGQGTLHGAGANQELAGTGLLHDLCSGKTKHLAKAFVAVDDATVLHLGVGNQKLAI